jgi:hypothetical protein
VLVPVMEVGIMRVGMGKPFVPMTVGMRFARRILRRMTVLVVLVMIMEMFMFHRLMHVFVLVSLGDV